MPAKTKNVKGVLVFRGETVLEGAGDILTITKSHTFTPSGLKLIDAMHALCDAADESGLTVTKITFK